MAYTYLFGPVHSRRLGISLGIDMVPFKTCSLNCIYCECGTTTELTLERKEYTDTAAIIRELDRYLSGSPKLDYVTLGGSGEPTLHSKIGDVIGFIKKSFPGYRVALLTNGTLFHDPSVRAAVMGCDVVLPSLDAVSGRAFENVNRPHGQLDNQLVIEGLHTFVDEFKGAVWLEVFIVPGVNDSDQELALFKKEITRINPTRIQLNSLDRPGTVDWIKPATIGQLNRIARALLPLPVEIITRSAVPYTIEKTATDESTMLALIGRRPMTLEEIAISLGRTLNDTEPLLESLREEGRCTVTQVQGRKLYTAVS